MMSIEYEGIVMPAVGLLNTGDVLYRQSNGRLTTERCFDGTRDTEAFVTLDIDFDAIALPDSFTGCDFDEDVEAMVYDGIDMIPISTKLIHHSPELPDDICYNLYGKYHISASDIIHKQGSKSLMYKDGNKIVCNFYMEDTTDEQLASIWNSIQDSEEHNYISSLELFDDLLIPAMVHKVDVDYDMEDEEMEEVEDYDIC